MLSNHLLADTMLVNESPGRNELSTIPVGVFSVITCPDNIDSVVANHCGW